MSDPVKLLAELRRVVAGEPDKIPAGFKRSTEWAKEWGVSQWVAMSLLRAGGKIGRIERRSFRIDDCHHAVPFYAEIKKPARKDRGAASRRA